MKTNQKSIFYYGIAAYGITWVFWITALSLGYKDISFTRLINWDFASTKQMALFLIFRIGVYGPLIAALLATLHFYKLAGLKELWQRITKWKVAIKWYGYIFYPVDQLGFCIHKTNGPLFNFQDWRLWPADRRAAGDTSFL